ncbi:hypothetical protein H0G86_000797 [Trichoderma simmonsii]|uniref:Uncharacterized protein n=1 Tax=Trichoderma simmonsii TaxID=1491479 RepID=A0A8G0P8L7_9HYPO|nr:hypothetical protein H0G86_000797 [Trichoderma simmonsii]
MRRRRGRRTPYQFRKCDCPPARGKQGLWLAYDDDTACFPSCIESTGLTSQPERQILSRGTGNVALGFRANYCTLGMAAALSIILRHVSPMQGYAMLFTAHLSFGGDALL